MVEGPRLYPMGDNGKRMPMSVTKIPCSFRTIVLIYKVSENQSVALNSSLLVILSVAKNSRVLPLRYRTESALQIEG
jgi:hypothetical protein